MKDKFNTEAQIIPQPEEEEIWVPAPSYEDRYEISNFGQLRNKKTQKLRKICYDNSGYPIVCLKINNIVHFVYIHRLVCEAFNGSPTKEYNVCDHIDHCIVNNYYRNLRWTDHSGNGLNRKTEVAKPNISLTKTPIVFLNLNGEFIQRFNNIIQAGNMLNISIQQIQQNLRGRRKPFKDGYFRIEADYLASLDKRKNF